MTLVAGDGITTVSAAMTGPVLADIPDPSC